MTVMHYEGAPTVRRRKLITLPSAANPAPSANASVAPSWPAKPKHKAANAADKVLLNIGFPSPARRLQIKPDKQQNRPGAHQPDAPDPREVRPARQIERHKHDREAGQAQRVHAEHEIFGQRRHTKIIANEAKPSPGDCVVAALPALTS